ncbi:MAG TPA: hypothetical protein VFK57_20670 [Vicinamibacterales bacterium]|nr:hypothetical protein [Vicinamibacterales bacterium]
MAWSAAAPAARASAQAATATLSANVGTIAKLNLSTASASFPDADPDAIPQIPTAGGPILITAKSRATPGMQVVLTLQAADDLRSGVNVIPAANITWTATGAGFVAGTLSTQAPVTLATWTGSGVRSGSQQLYFRNLWTHPTGTYTVSLLYTLSAP